MNWTNGEHAMAVKEERERVRREVSIALADWQASSEAYRLDAEQLRAEVDQLRAALQKIADNDFTMRDEMLTDSRPGPVWQAVARAALEPKP